MRPDVSVVVPCYNAQAWIGRAIASARAQRGAGIVEVVVADDYSTDATVATVGALADSDPWITLVRNHANMGPGGTRNRAIEVARAPWVALLDADDAFAPGRLARLLQIANAEGADVVADLPILFDLAANAVAPTQLKASGGVRRLDFADLLGPDPATGLDLGLLKPMFRRQLAIDGLWRYGSARHGEDFELYACILAREVPFFLLEEAYYLFSARIGEISGKVSPGSVTQVDYRGIARQARCMAQSHRTDQRIMALLEARARDALSANRAYGWTMLRKGEWTRFSRWLVQHPRNVIELSGVVLAKLGGHRGPVG